MGKISSFPSSHPPSRRERWCEVGYRGVFPSFVHVLLMLPSSLNKFAGEEENPMFCCLGVEGGWKTQTMISHSPRGWRRDFSQLWSFDTSGRDRDHQFLDLYLTPPLKGVVVGARDFSGSSFLSSPGQLGKFFLRGNRTRGLGKL